MTPDKARPRAEHPGSTHQTTTTTRSTDRVRDPVPLSLCIAEIVEILAADRPDYEQGWRDGFRVGYYSGREDGRVATEAEHDRQWVLAATPIVELIRTVPAYAELERRRNQPHGEAYEQALQRRGGKPYEGGPVRWSA